MDSKNCGLKPTAAAGKTMIHGKEKNVQNEEEGPNRMDSRDDGLKKPEAASKANMHGPGKKHTRAERGKEKMQDSELNGKETGAGRRAEMLQLETIPHKYTLTFQNLQIMKLELKEEMRWEKKERRWRW
ncbi:hypothetical protein OIU76_029881 [Salix suchowensis]|nr:hypothetical protein OIU76_029881 [Salix suchowensis]